MSLIDDARKIAEYPPRSGETDGCVFCSHYGHESDCPLLSMPKIVAALEALKEFVRCEPDTATHNDRLEDHSIECAACCASTPCTCDHDSILNDSSGDTYGAVVHAHYPSIEHEDFCVFTLLREAHKG